MSQNPNQKQGPTYSDIYQQFNANDLQSRSAFEMIYNICLQLDQSNKQLNTQLKQLLEEKEMWINKNAADKSKKEK